MDAPRIAELLGVKPMEWFWVKSAFSVAGPYRVTERGYVEDAEGDDNYMILSVVLCDAINSPECITKEEPK